MNLCFFESDHLIKHFWLYLLLSKSVCVRASGCVHACLCVCVFKLMQTTRYDICCVSLFFHNDGETRVSYGAQKGNLINQRHVQSQNVFCRSCSFNLPQPHQTFSLGRIGPLKEG